MTMAKRYYEKDGNLDAAEGQDGRHYRLRQPGPRARAESARLRRRTWWSACTRGCKSWAKAEAAGLQRHDRRRSGQGRRRDHDPGPRSHPGRPVREGDRAAPDAGQDADVRARLQHPLRLHQAAGRMSTCRMIAPKAPGHRVRELFTEGVGVPGAGRGRIRTRRARRSRTRWLTRWRSAA